MTEGRQASRREPILVTVREKTYIAEPLPWQKAGDLGNEIVRQNAETANELVRLYVDDSGLPQLEMKLRQKISNWGDVLVLAYPGTEPHEYDPLDIDECAELVLAALEVNHLEHIKHLVDPNFQPPTSDGGTDSSPGVAALLGLKIESTQLSSPTDSVENPPSPSPVESS